jgi:hypothetical protein
MKTTKTTILDVLFKHDQNDNVARMLRCVQDGNDFSNKCIAKEIILHDYADHTCFEKTIFEEIYKGAIISIRTEVTPESIMDSIVSEANEIAVRNMRRLADVICVSENCGEEIEQAVRLYHNHFEIYKNALLTANEILLIGRDAGLFNKNHVTDGVGTYYQEQVGENYRAGYVMDAIENFVTLIKFKNL